MFIKLNYNLFISVIKSVSISSTTKLVWIKFFSRSYKNYVKNKDYKFICNYSDLMKDFSCGKSKISQIMIQLEKEGYIKRRQIKLKQEKEQINSRKDKSLWEITLELPETDMENLVNQNDRLNLQKNINFEINSDIEEEKSYPSYVRNTDPPVYKILPHNRNKKHIINIKSNNVCSFKNEINLVSELIKKNVKKLPISITTKAKKFAYSLYSKRLVEQETSRLNKHNLAKELIFHASEWEPKKLGNLTKETKFNIALSVAWKLVCEGKWKTPRKLEQAKILNEEYKHYKDVSKGSKTIALELLEIQSKVSNKLGLDIDLISQIKQFSSNKGIKDDQYNNRRTTEIHPPYQSLSNLDQREKHNNSYMNHIKKVLKEMKERDEERDISKIEINKKSANNKIDKCNNSALKRLKIFELFKKKQQKKFLQ